MDYIDIKHGLEKKGYTWSRVARELSLAGPSSVTQVVNGTYDSARVEERVAEILGKPLYTVFPDRYRRARDGSSIRKKKTGGMHGRGTLPEQ